MKFFIYLYLIFFLTNDAFAYIDPGIGSFLIQSIIAIFAGVMVFFSNIKSKLKELLEKIIKKKK